MLYIDGIGYKIDVLSVKRTADFLDKYAERTENGDLERELIGVYFNYKLQLGPGVDRAEYARLWGKLTEPAIIPLPLIFPTWQMNCCAKWQRRTTGRI